MRKNSHYNKQSFRLIIFEYKLKLQSHIAIDKFIFILFSIHKDTYVYRKIQIFLKKKSFIKKNKLQTLA